MKITFFSHISRNFLDEVLTGIEPRHVEAHQKESSSIREFTVGPCIIGMF